ncbi:MAG TPA: hypothetical protein VIF62_05000 [Labilithrix sp.]|jgi:hypothetical protein
MRVGRALLFGVVGAIGISIVSALLRTIGLNIDFELILGTLTGIPPGPEAFAAGLGIHLVLGCAFGVLYGWLFERVWDHGGAATGVILGMVHAAFLGMFFGLTPQFHPYVAAHLVPDPGPYFVHAGGAAGIGVVAWFSLHIVFGAIVGAGYGHVAAEREWAPAGRL